MNIGVGRTVQEYDDPEADFGVLLPSGFKFLPG